MGDADRSEITWRKSRASGRTNCVEVAFADDVVLVRNSRDVSGPVLSFSQTEWAAFLADARAGAFDIAR